MAEQNHQRFSVKTIPPANPEDARGRAWQWKLPEGRQITICERNAGSESSHMHKGKDPSKDPERLFIARGVVKIIFKIYGKITKKVLRAGDSVEIGPAVWHKMEVIEDALILEYRITHFDSKHSDTFQVEF